MLVGIELFHLTIIIQMHICQCVFFNVSAMAALHDPPLSSIELASWQQVLSTCDVVVPHQPQRISNSSQILFSLFISIKSPHQCSLHTNQVFCYSYLLSFSLYGTCRIFYHKFYVIYLRILISFFSFQLVMVVDARDPLFYRCLDLEVMLSLFCFINCPLFDQAQLDIFFFLANMISFKMRT